MTINTLVGPASKSILPLLLIGCLIRCDSKKEEWISLFNGQDLSGWVVKAKPSDLGKNYWNFSDGCILANSLDQPEHDYVWLMSEREYEDFELKFKFQAFRGITGNSGIQVRSRYNDVENWLNGPQIDIHPSGHWRTGMMWDETKGNQRWIFPEIPKGEWVNEEMVISHPEFYFADDQKKWNEMLVRVDGFEILAWLNGTQITRYNGKGTLDDDLHSTLQVGLNGHIAFQIHTGDSLKILFKDIYIREL